MDEYEIDDFVEESRQRQKPWDDAKATGCCEVYDDPQVYVCIKRYMEWLTGEPCDVVQDAEDLIFCDEHKNVFKPLAVFELIDYYWNMEEVK